jgi:hypothetical protein
MNDGLCGSQLKIPAMTICVRLQPATSTQPNAPPRNEVLPS